MYDQLLTWGVILTNNKDKLFPEYFASAGKSLAFKDETS